jgi:serine/threonine protein kinase
MTGGSIAFHLEKSNRFKENYVKFYSSQIISAIVYLHSNNSIILYKFKFIENLFF